MGTLSTGPSQDRCEHSLFTRHSTRHLLRRRITAAAVVPLRGPPDASGYTPVRPSLHPFSSDLQRGNEKSEAPQSPSGWFPIAAAITHVLTGAWKDLLRSRAFGVVPTEASSPRTYPQREGGGHPHNWEGRRVGERIKTDASLQSIRKSRPGSGGWTRRWSSRSRVGRWSRRRAPDGVCVMWTPSPPSRPWRSWGYPRFDAPRQLMAIGRSGRSSISRPRATSRRRRAYPEPRTRRIASVCPGIPVLMAGPRSLPGETCPPGSRTWNPGTGTIWTSPGTMPRAHGGRP